MLVGVVRAGRIIKQRTMLFTNPGKERMIVIEGVADSLQADGPLESVPGAGGGFAGLCFSLLGL
jgi:hypothetical protein